jgi:cell division protease FtsH
MTTKRAAQKQIVPAGFEKARPAADQSEREENVDLAIETIANVAAPPSTLPDVRKALLTAVIRQATTVVERRRLLRSERPAAVVIAVPSKGWVEPVKKHLEEIGGGKNWKFLAHNGQFKSEQNPEAGNDIVANALRRGRSVVGIATDPVTLLPRTLVLTADVTVRLRLPTAMVVQKVLRRHFSDHRIVVGDDAVFGLDLDDIVAAMRAGSGPTEIVDLLSRASRRRSAGEDLSSVPNLSTAIEFGEAQTFALALVKDLVDFREGRLKWADAAKGAIFFGEPGNGKSVLAASIAKAASVPFIRYSVGSLFSHDAHLGTVLAAQRAIYAKAALLAPCVLMLDECESMPRRDTLSNRGRDWWLPVIDDALLLSDAGISDADNAGGGRPAGVVLLGATNALDLVDPAFLRPNRFETAIEIGRPKFEGVCNILRFHLKKDLVGTDIDDVARTMEGSTAAENMDVVRNARRIARHAGRDLALADLKQAANGDALRPPALDWRCAVHEAGHAVATIAVGAGTLNYATLQSHGRTGGHVSVDDDDSDLDTLDTIERKLVACLAAGTAEEAIIGTASTGSRNDLKVATSVLAHVHTSTSLMGALFHRGEGDDALKAARWDPDLRRRIEDHLQLLNRRARELVDRHRDRVVAVAEALRERRYLTAEAIVEIVSALPQNDERVGEPAHLPPVVVEDQGAPRREKTKGSVAKKGYRT